MVYAGHMAYVLVGQETAWGTAVSATKDLGLIQNITINDNNSLRRLHALSTLSTQAIVAGRYDMAGSLEVIYQHGRLFEYILGTVAHDAANTPDIKHTFSESDTPPSMTLEDGYDSTSDSVQKYAGVRLTSLTLSLTLDGSVRIRTDFAGKTVADTTSAQTAVVSTLAPLSDFEATLGTGTAGSETTVSNVQSFDLTINNYTGGEGKLYGFGSRLPTDLQPNQRTWEFRFTMAFANQTEYELFLGGAAPSGTSTPTLPSLDIDITNGVALASGRRQINIQLANCSYNTSGKTTNLAGYIFQEFVGWCTGLGSNGFITYDDITEANWS